MIKQDPVLLLSCMLLVIAAFAGTLVTVIYNWDRVVVAIMRRCHIHVYPVAIHIAMMIEEHPEHWSSDRYHMSHPDIGSIWIANAAYGLHVETPFGDWKPGVIERRIIRDAVDWRLNNYIRERVASVMRRYMLGSV